MGNHTERQPVSKDPQIKYAAKKKEKPYDWDNTPGAATHALFLCQKLKRTKIKFLEKRRQ